MLELAYAQPAATLLFIVVTSLCVVAILSAIGTIVRPPRR